MVFGPLGAPDTVIHVVFGHPGAPDTVNTGGSGPRAPTRCRVSKVGNKSSTTDYVDVTAVAVVVASRYCSSLV